MTNEEALSRVQVDGPRLPHMQSQCWTYGGRAKPVVINGMNAARFFYLLRTGRAVHRSTPITLRCGFAGCVNPQHMREGRADLAERFSWYVDKNGSIPPHRLSLGQCWLYTGYTDAAGYGSFWLNGRMHPAHRVSLFIHRGDWPPECALHACDNRRCVRPSHLFEGDQKANAADREAKGRGVIPRRCGAKHPFAALTEVQVRDIRSALASNTESQSSIARRFGVTRSAINSIKNGYTWRSLA